MGKAYFPPIKIYFKYHLVTNSKTARLWRQLGEIKIRVNENQTFPADVTFELDRELTTGKAQR